MAPKKKKTQLKPVARGFATTSVPKKVVEVPKEPEPEASKDDPALSSEQTPDSATTGSAGKVADPNALSESDQVLQNFIDKFQDKVEKEIVRNVKVRRAYPHPSVVRFTFCAIGYRAGKTLLRHSPAS